MKKIICFLVLMLGFTTQSSGTKSNVHPESKPLQKETIAQSIAIKELTYNRERARRAKLQTIVIGQQDTIINNLKNGKRWNIPD